MPSPFGSCVDPNKLLVHDKGMVIRFLSHLQKPHWQTLFAKIQNQYKFWSVETYQAAFWDSKEVERLTREYFEATGNEFEVRRIANHVFEATIIEKVSA